MCRTPFQNDVTHTIYLSTTTYDGVNGLPIPRPHGEAELLVVIGMKTGVVAAMFLSMAKVAAFRTSSPKVVSSNSSHHILGSFRLQRSLATVATGDNSQYYTIGITGAGGLVGTALRNELARRSTVNGKNVRVVRLQRGTAVGPLIMDNNSSDNEAAWNPAGTTADEVMDPTTVAPLDAVVHLAGESVATGTGPLGFLGLRPWSADKKDRILNSRVGPTQALSRAIAAAANQKKPAVFLVASGVGAYGDHFVSDQVPAVDESTDTSTVPGFLARVARASEAATAEAEQQTRVVNMRFGVVLSKRGGALAKLFPVFFLGGGGNVGSGRQYFSFISARDLARAIVFALEMPSLKGPVNFSAPHPCTNAEFTTALGKNMGRPTILPLPAFVVKAVFGEMGEEMLLGGVRALPSKLAKSGFEFEHATIDEAVKSALEEEI